MRRRSVLGPVVALVLTLAGGACGTSRGDVEQASAERLLDSVETIRAAAAAGDRAAAESALAAFHEALDREVEAGTVPDEAVDEISDAAASVGARLALLPPPEPVVVLEVSDKGHGHKGGKGEGKDDDRDDEDDD